jgi:L-aspartate oxidase
VFGARAAQAAVAEPRVRHRPPVPDWAFTPPTTATREAMWRLAGPWRQADQLEQLLDDPYPVARLIARAALSRQESRGAHRRIDFPHRDPSLDGVHLVIDRDETVRREHWP